MAAPAASPTPAAQAAATVQRARVSSPLTTPKPATPAPKPATPAAAGADDWQSF
jgi:hypothetical protein